MSSKKTPKKVKLVISVFGKDRGLIKSSIIDLSKKFGIIDYQSDYLKFKETDYYENEMGENLLFTVISFDKLISRSKLPEVKVYCWKLENKYSIKSDSSNNRDVNIDPGLMALENFILATGKGFGHRIYLNKGVYADLTLIYKNNDYMELPWTYLNYKTAEIKNILKKIRTIYHNQLKES